MTPKEIQAAVRALRDEIGGKCDVSFWIASDAYRGKPITIHCRPRGYKVDAYIHGEVDDWPEALAFVRAKWAEIAADVRRETVRKMALAIIRITADIGQCTNAALRADDFTERDIEMYGEEACQQADSMAANGPFKITALVGANAA